MYLRKHFTQFLAVLFAVVVALQLVEAWKLYADDPLTVTYHGEPDRTVFLNPGDSFTFRRDVCVEQDIDVTVHREFHSMTSGDKFMLSGIRYVAYAEDGCYTAEFSATVPDRMPVGPYEYRPILIYDVNNRLTIAKPAPFVRVEVIE